MATYAPYEFESMIKYLVFKLAHELQTFIKIFTDEKLTKKVN